MKNVKSIMVIGILITVALLPMIKADVQPQTTIKSNLMTQQQYLNSQQLLITYHLSEVTQEQIRTFEGLFTKLTVPNHGFIGNIGSPQLPALTQIYAVPTLDFSFEIVSVQKRQTTHVGRVIPVQPPHSDGGDEQAFIYDESAYQQNSAAPDPLVEVVDRGKIRDVPFVKIRFYPIQYTPSQQQATFYDTIQIKLTFPKQEPLVMEQNFKQKPYYGFYGSVFPNWGGFIEHTSIQQQASTKNQGCDYLVITHGNYYTQAKQLADWKHMSGLMAKTVNVSDIGTTANQIRQYIQNAYDTWTPKPSYVLLVGDAEFIPTNYPYGAGSDLWYTTVDGSDYYPDIFIGRIPADNAAQAEVMVQKILTYEQTPPTLPSFYENFVVAAFFQDDNNDHYEDRRFVRTSEEIRDYLNARGYAGQRIYCTPTNRNPTHYNNGYYGNGEPLPAELLRPTFPWNGQANDLISAINQGIFILNHRDHGMESGWGDPYFTTSHFSSLTNGELLPVVFSINCLTGKFAPGECFAEEFIRKPGGGAVAVFGASEVSYSGYNDYLCRGFYDAMWPDFDPAIGNDVALHHLGQILNYGKTYMANTWGDPWGYERLTFELFHVFGDPSLDIYTSLPAPLDVTFALLSDVIQVTVKTNGNPLKASRVCISQQSGFYQTGLTDVNGIVQLEKTGADIAEMISLIVTAHNHLYHNESFLLNQKPQTPNPPTGPTQGKPNTDYIFRASTIDADGDRIYYNFSWGDGTYSDWIGPFDSGVEATAKHSWAEKGTFNIMVKAKDIKGDESDWSDPLVVTMPTKLTVFLSLLQWLSAVMQNRFPFVTALLQRTL